MTSEATAVNQWSKDSSHHGHGHLLNAEIARTPSLDPRTLGQTHASGKGQNGSSSGLPLSASETSPRLPIYDAKPPPQPPASGQTEAWDIKYAEYSDPAKRVESFVGWPIAVVGQDPRKLALCGFFYIGSADRVRCFSCGTTLRNWEPQDSPFQEHVTWAPKCTFIHRIQEPTQAAIAALPDPPSTSAPVAQAATPASSVVKDSPVARDAVVAQAATPANSVVKDSPVAKDTQSNGDVTEKVVVQEVTAPAVAEWSSASSSQQMSGNGGSAVGVPMATTDVMKSPLVLAVLEMGVPEVKVREVIRQRGYVFTQATELFLATEAVSVDSG